MSWLTTALNILTECCLRREFSETHFDVSSRARLLETDTYSIRGHKAFYGFLAGICAGNYDVTDILVDATFKIVGRDYEELPQFFEMLSNLSESSDVNFVFTISCDKEDLPVDIFDYCEEI